MTRVGPSAVEPDRRRPRKGVVELPDITPITVTRLADELAKQIRDFIIAEDVEAGSRLPSERDLAVRFGASRPTISQALRTLSLMGLVEIRRGSGAYVLRRPESMVTASVSLMLDLEENSVSDLMQLRLWLETIGVEQAACRIHRLTDCEVDEVTNSLDNLAGAAGVAALWISADTVFHATLVRFAGNPYLAALYESVHTAILSYEYEHWVESESVPGWLIESTPEQQRALHEPIAKAVLERDPIKGAEAVLKHHEVMARHLDGAHRSTSDRARRAPSAPR